MHIVITGASSGIGAALARELAYLPDARLTLVARRRAPMQALARELTGRAPCHIEARDLALDTPSDWLAEAAARQGPIDTLVNNAGVQVVADTARVDVAAGERSVFLNLLLPLRLTRAVLPSMLARRRGHVVNITSMAAIAPTPWMTYYNASKAGLAAASEALAGEVRGSGVGIVTVYPGILAETELAQRALARYEPSRALALQPQGTPAELARHIRRALTRPGSKRIIYPRANMLARWFPGTTRFILDRFAPGLRAEMV